ncbi:MAG: hypothetical protein C0467_24970 [Planctomycetaceae bacterium]|nr:hypothetical protein [Planctomycetaceae bacterium]
MNFRVEIRIAGYVAASLILERDPAQWHALVMLDSDVQETDFVPTHTRSHLFVRFDDIEEPRERKHLPSKSLLRDALQFAHGKDKLLVSCRAGRGRSAAVAYTIACQQLGVDEAVKLLDPTRHRPNQLVVRLGSELLEDSTPLAEFERWRRDNANVRRSDFYDDMEREFDSLEAQGATNKICVATKRRL